MFLIRSVSIFSVELYAWVILDNHYHLLFWLKWGLDLPRFIQNFHTNSSRLLNKLARQENRKVWYQYQDHGIRNEKNFWQHFNYIHHNPIKHGYVKNMADYEFASL